MKIHLKPLLFVAALGAAAAARAQGLDSAGAVPAIPDPSPLAMPADNTGAVGTPAASQQEFVPANHNDPIGACAEVPAADVDACISREAARTGMGKGGTSASKGSKKASSNSRTSGARSSSTADSTAPNGTTPLQR